MLIDKGGRKSGSRGFQYKAVSAYASVIKNRLRDVTKVVFTENHLTAIQKLLKAHKNRPAGARNNVTYNRYYGFMNSADLQQVFFTKLKNVIPANISMVDEIADILDIGYDSVYRRIRGEKPITLGELK